MSAVLAQPVVPAAPSPLLLRCLLLALLLHVWLALLLGNAPGGTAREGQGVWGAINITLRGPETPGATETSVPPQPEVPTGAPGAAPVPRWGGAVREAAPTPAPEPGAAQVGDWAQRAPAVPAPAAAETPPAAEPSSPPAAAPAPPPPPGRVLEERALATPLPQAAALPAAPTPLSTPALPPLPTPPALRPPVAAPERQLSASPLSRPPLAAAPAAALSNTAPALPAAAPEALPRLPELAPAPAPLPEPVLRQLAPAVAPPSAPLTPVAPVAPLAPITPSAPAAAALASTPLPQATALPAPGPAAPAAATNPGAPDAGARVGHDVATAPSAAASQPPRLNLELARPRGGELSRGRSAGLLPLLPRPPDTDKLGREIEKAAKADCRNAHAGAGLLAVVPLAVDAVRKDGCKW
jgi:hypothetical protein